MSFLTIDLYYVVREYTMNGGYVDTELASGPFAQPWLAETAAVEAQAAEGNDFIKFRVLRVPTTGGLL